MNIKELSEDVALMLHQLKLSSRKASISKDRSILFIVEDFGLIVCCIERIDYVQIKEIVAKDYKDWRLFFIATSDNVAEKKNQVLWDLMRCGYMKWLRFNFPRQIKNVLIGPNNLGNKIIEERLRVWNGRPKYKYLIEDNRVAIRNGVQRELTNDPSFFDYMPEEEINVC